MKKVLLIAIFSFLINGVFGQTSTPGVTVIVHGFDAGGDYGVTSGFSSWQAHAISLREYLKQVKNKNAIVLTNDLNTGFWKVLDIKKGALWGTNYHFRDDLTISEIDNSEKIFLYNWADLSNDGLLNGSSGIDALEAAGDNLFSMLVNPVVAIKNKD